MQEGVSELTDTPSSPTIIFQIYYSETTIFLLPTIYIPLFNPLVAVLGSVPSSNVLMSLPFRS